MSTNFEFSNIAGQDAWLHVNDRGNHCIVTWGALTVCDASGHIGFWETFKGQHLKGAARRAALRAHARAFVESEIYTALRVAQDELASV